MIRRTHFWITRFKTPIPLIRIPYLKQDDLLTSTDIIGFRLTIKRLPLRCNVISRGYFVMGAHPLFINCRKMCRGRR